MLIANMPSFIMDARDSAAFLVRTTRQQAGFSQRELAARARTAQSVVARIESGQTDPGLKTLRRLLAAAGYALTANAVPCPAIDTHMIDDVRRILHLSPEQRLREVGNIHRFLAAARRV